MKNIPTIFPLKNTPKLTLRKGNPSSEITTPLKDASIKVSTTVSTSPATLATERVSLEKEIENLHSKMVSLSLANERLQTEINSLKFGFNRCIGSDVDMNY